MDIKGKVAIITGAASGIGRAAALELQKHEIGAIALVDMADSVHAIADELNALNGRETVRAFQGDTTDETFRKRVFDSTRRDFGVVNICVPAAGITRDALAVRVNREKGRANIYPIENFRHVLEVNLIAPIYWALELVAQMAEERFSRGAEQWEPAEGVQGVIVFIGSVSAQGNKGQISYATGKVGLEGAASTLMKEAMYYGVRCTVIHPGFTDTPMVRSLGEDYIANHVIPATQIGRLIRPEEIADAICFLIRNSAVSGQLWADAGWHPMPT
ncbi:MAG TPA: short-chain dehydrogenase [Gammaproteobacteria bacterium]|nr:short-chain dehydrogenase [Gammaproteobacteria bacterium]|tara:strand:- start:7295 stop:8113 length:819 start_codon:yes stop_codon:yes gene_type:complete